MGKGALPGWRDMALGGEELLQEGRLGQGFPRAAGSPAGSQGSAWRCRRKEFWREAGLLESRRGLRQWPGILAPFPPWGPLRIGSGRAQVGGDAPAGTRGAAPEGGSVTASLFGGGGGGGKDGEGM